MDNIAAGADDTIFCEKAYYEALIMDVVAQSAAPLPEHMVRMHVYRSINEAYERALAQLVTKGELSYSDGLYHLVHGEEDALQTVVPAETGRMALRADTTIDSLKSCAYGSLFPVVAAISFDSKPDDGLALMGYHALAAEAEEALPKKATVERNLGDTDDVESAEAGETAAAAEEPNFEPVVDINATANLNPESVGDATAPKAADPESVTSVGEPKAAGLESTDSKPVDAPEQADDTQPAAVAVLEPSADAARRLERPQYLSGWDDPRCVFDSATQVAFLDKKGVADVFGLIRELGKVPDSPVRSAFEQKLCPCALPLSPQYRAQATELSKLSGNKNFVFDIYGNLRMIGPDCPIFENVKGPMSETLSTVYAKTGEPLSLWNLSISPALQRKLKWDLKIRNLPELLACTPSRLRVRGLASSDVHSIIEALDAWPSGRLTLEKTSDELKLARQAAMGGWYPKNDTTLKHVEMVNGLADETVIELQREKLPVSEPSFRLLFCTKLAGKLGTTIDKAAAVNMSLSGFKNEYPAVKAARETFARLDFALSAGDLNSDALDADSAEASFPADVPNADAATCAEESSHTGVHAAASDTVSGQEPKADADQNTMAFNKWLEALSYNDRLLMECMLLEDNPQKWQANVVKTAEYIRRRYVALMDERPRFDIDGYASLFKAYKLAPEEFYALSGSTSPAFPYMKRVYKQGALPLKYATIDTDLDQDIRAKVSQLLDAASQEDAAERPAENAEPAKSAASAESLSSSSVDHASVLASAPKFVSTPVPSASAATGEHERIVAPALIPVITAAAAPAPKQQEADRTFTAELVDLSDKGPMTIDQWLALLSDDDADLLRWVFGGKQLMDYPDKPGGLGQLRCRRGDLMRRRPKLEEDRYASFYERYDLNEKMFCKITQASPMAFYYLKSCKVSTKFNVRLAVNDAKLPQEWRDRVAALNRPSVLPVDHRADAVQSDSTAPTDAATQRPTLEQLASRHRSGFATRNAALCAFAESGMVEGYCDLKDLRSMYQLFLERNKCGYRQALALPVEDNKCINALRGTHMFLVPRATKIRSYKVESGLTSELRYILLTEAGRNIECGAGLILREHQDLFDLYDIHDDEELYEIIRSFVRPDTVHGLEIGTIPLIRLGKTDRKQQMIDLLRDANAELTGEELSQLYSDTYCISKRTVRVNYLRDLKAYVRNGRYSYVESELSPEQQQFIKDMVTDDYVSLPFVAARFAAAYPDASERLINDQSLESLGLEISRELIVKKGVDLKRAFRALLRSKDSFAYGSPGFGDEVVTHPDFVSVMAAFLRDFTFIECNRDSFLSLKRLDVSMHIGYYDLSQYARAMFDLTKPGVPFTVTSLRKQGFTHRLDAAFEECGFDEAFYDSLILNALAQEGIKRTRIGGICIFCRKDGSFSSADAIEYVVKQTGPIELDDLVDVFQNEYGVEMASTDIKRAAEEKDLFYNEDLEMVMPNKEANAAYLRGLISNNRL